MCFLLIIDGKLIDGTLTDPAKEGRPARKGKRGPEKESCGGHI